MPLKVSHFYFKLRKYILVPKLMFRTEWIYVGFRIYRYKHDEFRIHSKPKLFKWALNETTCFNEWNNTV